MSRPEVNVASGWPRSLVWFREFLQVELSPYPGRIVLVARMVLAATVLMIIFMTFRIPNASLAALYGLIISREDPQTTIDAVKTNIIAFFFSAIFVFVGAMLFAGDPMLRLLWVIAALFTVFFNLSSLANYTAAARFGWMVVIIIPLWDEHVPPETKVENTLWTVGALMLASLVTAAIELVFAALLPSHDLSRSLDERLTTVEEILTSFVEDKPVSPKTADHLTRLAMLGTSRLRRVLAHSSASLEYGEQMGAVVAIVGRVMDLAAGLMNLNPRFTEKDRRRMKILVENIAAIRLDLKAEKMIAAIHLEPNDNSSSVPLLGELEKAVGMIPEVFTGQHVVRVFALLPQEDSSPVRLFSADAFTNPDHIRFALNGCLAASLCYVIYMALDWPGISTAVTTCFLTALSNVGLSRQMQVLRITGTIVGGLVGLFAQIFILPRIDSIVGFTVVFIAVTFVASWIVSSGPRLSYFGVQFAYAYYVTNLSEFAFQTSLVLGRDRVLGILLGLVVMWYVFDQLWGAPAIDQMKNAFIALLRALANMIHAPFSQNLRAAIQQSYALRETVDSSFNKVRAMADGVMFEFGPARDEHLAIRHRIVSWMPELRMLFVSCITLLKYRLQSPGFELPEPVRAARHEFEESLAHVLEGIANRLQNRPHEVTQTLEAKFARLKDAVQKFGESGGPAEPGARLNTLLSLSGRITELAVLLDKKIQY